MGAREQSPQVQRAKRAETEGRPKGSLGPAGRQPKGHSQEGLHQRRLQGELQGQGFGKQIQHADFGWQIGKCQQQVPEEQRIHNTHVQWLILRCTQEKKKVLSTWIKLLLLILSFIVLSVTFFFLN